MPMPGVRVRAYRQVTGPDTRQPARHQKERPMDYLLVLALIVLSLIALDLAALAWGVDSRVRLGENYRI